MNKSKKIKITFSNVFPNTFYSNLTSTGKSLSEALIFASINPIVHGITSSVHENYKRRTWAEHVLAMFCACSWKLTSVFFFEFVKPVLTLKIGKNIYSLISLNIKKITYKDNLT